MPSSAAPCGTRSCPVPMPMSKRPWVSTERLCASHAACRGVRSGLASTNVPTRTGATVAATASEENGESNCTPSGMSTVE